MASRSLGTALTAARAAVVTGSSSGRYRGEETGVRMRAVDGQPTRTPEDFLATLRPHRPGDTLRLTVRTSGQGDRAVDLTVTDRPS
jgi:hypothetical protein